MSKEKEKPYDGPRSAPIDIPQKKEKPKGVTYCQSFYAGGYAHLLGNTDDYSPSKWQVKCERKEGKQESVQR